MSMLAVCPACQRPVGQRSIQEQADVADDVCGACRAHERVPGSAAVVRRLSADTLAILRALSEVAPEFLVLLDRRSETPQASPDRRRSLAPSPPREPALS